MFAVLAHDFGKPATTREELRDGRTRWISPGHEPVGAPLAEAFLRRIGAPHLFLDQVPPLVANHMVHHHGGPGGLSSAAVRRLARRLHPATIDDLALVMTADSLGRPPRQDPATLALIDALRERARTLAVAAQAPRPILLGRHLVTRGLRPGPAFKAVLAAAFEAQLDGAFADESTALIWLSNYLQNSPPPRA